MSDPASQLTVAWLHLLIFPALIGIALLSLRYFAYQNLKNVNEVFVEGYRSPKLRSTLTTIMFLTVAAFISVQIVRFPFLVSVATDLIHWTGQRAWLQTGAAVFFAQSNRQLIRGCVLRSRYLELRKRSLELM